MEACCSSKSAELEQLAVRTAQRRVLLIVLALNAAMFFVEFFAGLLAGSAALMADSADMLGDALVYGLSLYVLNRGEVWKARAALVKGGLILLLGIGVLIQLGVNVATGSPPSSAIMFWTAGGALCVNVLCLALLWRFRRQDMNMSSTVECSRNDGIANAGVIVASAGVMATQSIWPDVIVGALITVIFVRSAVGVISGAYPVLRQASVRA